MTDRREVAFAALPENLRATRGWSAADRYDGWFDTGWGAYAFLIEARAITRATRGIETRRLLDVGCGTGRFAYELETPDATLVGLDREPAMPAVAGTATRTSRRMPSPNACSSSGAPTRAAPPRSLMTPADELPASRGVLAVCAHPDDESFGLGGIIAAYTRRGTPVDLVCLTRGEASSLGTETNLVLADARADELAAATQTLGIRSYALHDFPDGALDTVPLDALAASIRPHAASIDTILVFDDTGITGHPDHQHATRAALAVADQLDVAALAWTLPETAAQTLNEEFGTSFVGRQPTEIDLRIPVDRAAQWNAIRQHHSQLRDNPVPARRLALTGPTECLRYLRRRRTSTAVRTTSISGRARHSTDPRT